MRGLNDLLPEIAKHATIETRMCMACVCRKWYHLINDNPYVWQELIQVFQSPSLLSFRERILPEHSRPKQSYDSATTITLIKTLPQTVRALQRYHQQSGLERYIRRSFGQQPPQLSKIFLLLLGWYSLDLICKDGTIKQVMYSLGGVYYKHIMSVPMALQIVNWQCRFKLDL